MLIGILGDTHDQWQRTQVAVDLLQAEGAEALFHCGDLIESDLIEICAVLPLYLVFGNNDVSSVIDIRLAMAKAPAAVCLDWAGEVTLEGKRIAIAHGHSEKDVRRLMAGHPDYLLTGHSHVAADWRDGQTRRINPGALHRASGFSVAILNLADDNLRFLPVPR